MAAPGSNLFANQLEANVASTSAMVEDVLVELGHELERARADFPECERSWRIAKGSATVEIAILVRVEAGAGPTGWLQVSASVMTPGPRTDRSALWRRVLQLNADRASTSSFALRGDTILLIGQRTTRDLDRSEVLHLIQVICDDADQYDDELVRAFGGRRGD
jgi:hypothetical protein